MSRATQTLVDDWNRPVLARFAERGADLIVLSRPVRFDLDERVRNATVAELRDRVDLVSASSLVREGLALIGLSDVEELAIDMTEVAEGFLRRFACEPAFLRVEIIDRKACPKFHQDNVNVRLLVTYAGPGTEYIARHDQSKIHSVPREAIVLMKGGKHPTNLGAILHRSPDLEPGQRRLCLVVDF